MTPAEHEVRVILLRHQTPCPAGQCDICDERRDRRYHYVEEHR